MHWTLKIVVLVFCAALMPRATVGSCSNLPDGCHCSHSKNTERVMCRNDTWISFKNLSFTGAPTNISYLSVSFTGITRLEKDLHLHLPSNLSKLDLTNNKINKIEENAFVNFSKLEKLDLSYNAISTLQPDSFKGLDSIKKLNLQGNPLLCDCHLAWILEWARVRKVKIGPKSNCQFPAQLGGLSLARINKKKMHCDWPLQLPVFEMSPSASQLVFEGDAMQLQCNVSNIDKDTQVAWILGDQLLPNSGVPNTEAMTLDASHSGLLVNSLRIGQLSLNHSGLWQCHVGTSRGNLSRSVKLVVVAKQAPSCPEIVVWGNKGKYHWPPTLAGIVADVACTGPPPLGLGYQPARAFHSCNAQGQWEALDTKSCPFISEVTLVLEQFAKANLSQGSGSKTVVDTARGLRNYTGNGSLLTDVMDIVFITRTLEKYLPFVPQHKELTDILLDVISTVMNVNPDLMKDAQVQDRACSRITQIVEMLSEAMADSTINRHNHNLIVEEFLIKSEVFPGIRCSSFEDQPTKKAYKKNLQCLSINSTFMHRLEKPVDASLYVPPSIFQSLSLGQDQSSSPSSPWGHTHKLQFSLYQSGALFPTLAGAKQITSPVIGCRAAYLPLGNLSQPVEATLQVPAYTPDVQPAFWDRSLNDGQGDWNTQGIHIISISGSTITFTSSFLGNFGIIQNVEAMLIEVRYQQAQFRLLHPAIYAGSLLSLICLVASMALYSKQWSQLQMSKNNKHSLLNTWLSLCLLIGVFSLGVTQTDFPRVCQAVGLSLHYLTLCTLTWMVITINNLYKSLSRREPVEDCGDDEDEPRDPSVPPKPILRFYLVGWGVAAIICGISASVQLDNYAGNKFCFLSQSSSLAALYGPVAILLLLILIYVLLIRCFLTPESELSGLPLVSSHPNSPTADTHSLIDSHFSSTTLLQSHAAVLVLFLLTWTFASLAISTPFSQQLPYESLIFGMIYCLSSGLLGAFVFLFFCYSRNDVGKCLSAKSSKAQVDVSIEHTSGPIEVAAAEVELEISDRQSKKITNETTEAVDKSCDVNLLANHAAPVEVVVASSLDLFYNPRQSIVARKFFEKNRRQQQLKMLHKNNLEKEAATNGSSISGRARAYSDTEHTTSVASGERHFLCTSQSYGGPSSHPQAELKALVHNSDRAKFTAPVANPSTSQAYAFVAKDSCGLPPWMVGITSCARSSCSECSNCTKPPLSLYSYSDITSVSQRANRRRPRSRNYGKYQKSHQYSWDDKYGDGRTKMFTQPLQDGHSTTGHAHRKHRRKVSSRNSVHLSPTPERGASKHAFSRSQSTNDQIGKHRVLLNEDRERLSQEHLETRM